MNTKISSALSTIVFLLVAGCNCAVNRSLRVADGEKVTGGLTTVNGTIRIGEDAEVRGASRTVNGRITVDDGAQVGSLTTVNGAVEIAGNVAVDGDVETVNGAAECGSGTEVQGDVSTVNGAIRLDGTRVEGRVVTYNGGVTLRDGSRVTRDVVIERTRGRHSDRALEIRILQGSVVEGDIVVRTTKRPVTVYLSEGGEVLGEIRNAKVVRES
ncbi:MAG: hypothetical protein GY856_04785 [bacterium]|nr:hypothetical protein [bacterium]